jgi:isopenicillin-N N-acyltransferase-like protein
LGQTKDTPPPSQDLYVVTAMYQQGRPDLLQMPYAGEMGVFGLSSAGMSAFGNSLYVRGGGRGTMPWSLFRRLTLEASSIDDVLGLIGRHGIATPGNLTIGDGTGRVVAVESTDRGVGVVEAQDGILVHANHIDSPGVGDGETYDEPEHGASRRRQSRMRALLEAERGRLTAPLAMRCLMDHANFPRSICRHASFAGDLETTAALVVEPAIGALHVIRGQPCRGWTATYSL